MWFFPIVPIRGRSAGKPMGIVSFRWAEKVHIPYKKTEDGMSSWRQMDFRACFADLPKGGLKKSVWKELSFMGKEHGSSPAAAWKHGSIPDSQPDLCSILLWAVLPWRNLHSAGGISGTPGAGRSVSDFWTSSGYWGIHNSGSSGNRRGAHAAGNAG